MSRPRKRLTVVTKSNAQRHGMVFWDAVCRDVLADFPALNVDFKLVDAMAALMVTKPEAIDTVVATNLHADILSDLASARSEEHTSELQSLMRISYAVFCLKKKTNKKRTTIKTK